MPLSTNPPRDPDGPRRRELLLAGGAAGAVVLLGGCSSGASEPGADEAGRGSDLTRLRARARRESTALLARYDATLAAHPALGTRLRPLREETARHLAAFTAGRAASGTPAPSPAARKPETKPSVPREAQAALAALAQAERDTADARTAALADAPGEFARLLASVAACGAAHAYLLSGSGS